MARVWYGSTPADFTMSPSGRIVAQVALSVWTARTGGTQVTDLLDHNGSATSAPASDSAGNVRFQGPDGTTSTLWIDSGQGPRLAVRPVNLPTADLNIGTVGTGTAAATLTPDGDDAWTLDLTLPSAGTDGVNTAAIQAKAVTAAKIADDTITATQIAANAVGSSELADGAVTSAKIADGAIVNADINAAAAIAVAKLAGHPTTTVDNTLPRFDGIGGSMQTSGIVVDDNNRLTVATGATGGYGFASGAVDLSGTGSPEGVVTAAPGSTWLQTDATTDVKGWIKWVKATGTGNTGWRVGPEADTGWRDITATLTPSGGTLNYVLVRRTGPMVTWLVDASATSSGVVVTDAAPAGLRPGRGWPNYTDTIIAGTLGAKFAILLLRRELVSIYGAESGTRYRGAVSLPTDDGWPTSLPGTAA